MKLWQRRNAVRSISGSARRARARDNTLRSSMDSSTGGQSPIGSASTWNFVAFLRRKKNSRPLVHKAYRQASISSKNGLTSAMSCAACS